MISRRQFIHAGTATVLAAALPLHAANKLKIGIGTYSYHNLSMDDMIAQLLRLRINEIEMSRGEFMLLSHPDDAIFKSAREKFDRAGIRCVSYYAATLKAEQDVENAIRFAKLLGANNITGDATGPLLKTIDQRVTTEGLTFGIHNHFFKEKFAYESAEDVLQALADLSPSMGATADTGHFASCGHDPVDAIRKLGPRLKLVHLKDIATAGDEVNVLLGHGISNIPGVMQELRKQHFRGLVAVEYEKEGRAEEDLKEEVAFARRLA